ncbi:uncharacterized protein LOC122500199 [Leptopilina heterotoma]|uniref:uncharacterized protein LOC122500199 n=1 Tax=Leptopilina heterotoma TaxID=63436 RepID=UPI001CA90729|nr:uncharacterized protein LOC122500199 [Leptopilina heterotoma]
MKIVISFTIFVITKLTLVRTYNVPAFAKPNLSNSYLPATMQVILYAVEQLKQLHSDGSVYNTNILISSSPHPPGLTTWQIVSKFGNDMEMTTSSYDELSNTQMKNNMFRIPLDYRQKSRSIHERTNLKSINKENHDTIKTFQKNINKLTDKFENLNNQKNDEIRIDLLGKRSASLQQLATLYDALNKDARGQGFSIYSGFSDEVINTLSNSTKAGIGLQLQKILEKSLERGEFTRDNTKILAKKAVNDLRDSKSYLSTDLRRLLPLKYVQ